MKKILKNGIIILFAIAMLFILTGCKDDEQQLLDKKVKAEIEYLDSKIIGMLNGINGISYQNYKISTQSIELDKSSGQSGEQTATSGEAGQKDKGEQGESQGSSEKEQIINKSEMSYNSILNGDNVETNWDLIKSEIEVLHSTWNTIVLDLNQKNLNEQDITNFGSELDSTTIAIKEENTEKSLMGLAKMYSYLPKFLGENNNSIDLKNVKVHVLNAYALVETENWDQIKNETDQAVSNFNTFMAKNQNSFNIGKANVALKELQNSVGLEDKQVFYIKYRNTIEQLGII